MSNKSPKNILQEHCVGIGWGEPSYEDIYEEQGGFRAKVFLKERWVFSNANVFRNKKSAHAHIAEFAYNLVINDIRGESLDMYLNNNENDSENNNNNNNNNYNNNDRNNLDILFKSLTLNSNLNREEMEIIFNKLKENGNNVQIKLDKSAPVMKFHKGDDYPDLVQIPRKYQEYFYRMAMERDIICCIPTGLGKTLIACMVIKKMHQLNPNKQILFLVERIPLVAQQEKVIRDQTKLLTIGLHGDQSMNKFYQPHNVLVVISSVFINLLRDGKVNLEQYSLIVFDEAHHIVKDHPFSVIMKTFYKKVVEQLQPKIMGLTASPVGKSTWFDTLISLKVMSFISNSSIVAPDEASTEEMSSHKKKANVEIEILESCQHETFFLKFIKSIHNFLEEYTKKTIPYIPNPSDYYAALESLCNGEGDSVIQGFALLMRTLVDKALELINTGYRNLDNQEIESPKLYVRNVIEGLSLEKGFKKRIQMVVDSIPFVDDDSKQSNICKLDKALEILERRSKESGDDFRAIIFVMTRQSAEDSFRILQVLSNETRYSFIRPDKVTGHASTKEFGQSTSKQKEVIERFRKGVVNVVIATSVLEEGLDVPECNVVIRLDSPSTVTAFTQSRGRLRHENSKFYAILKDFEPNTYSVFDRQEIQLMEAIQFLQDGILPPSYNEMISKSAYPKQEYEELIVKCKVHFKVTSEWSTVLTGGSPHLPEFTSTLKINGDIIVIAKGSSKKDAENRVCTQVLEDGIIPKLIRDLNSEYFIVKSTKYQNK